MAATVSFTFNVFVTLTIARIAHSFYDVAFCAIALRDDVHACYNKDIYNVCKFDCDSRRIDCHNCHHVNSPERCTSTKTCDPSQVCVMTGYVDEHFRLKYNLGCANRTQCSIFNASGKKRNSVHVAGYCCDHNGCNNQQTPSQPPVSSISCMDSNPSACQYIAKHYYNPCSDSVIGQTLCRAMCGTCRGDLYCYNCQKMEATQQCKNKSRCEYGAVCGISKNDEFSTDTFNVRTYYNMACMDKQMCSILETRHDVNCCNTSLCNNHYLMSPSVLTTPPTTKATTKPTTPTTIPTTTPTTTTTTVTYPQLTCDVDFIQVGGSCYYINPEGRTEKWEDAKIICMALNSHLAAFETEAELNEMRKYLQTQHGSDRHYSYWTGGMRVNQTSSWQWEFTGTAVQPLTWYSSNQNAKGQDCLEYGPMYDYKWNNANCEYQANFICEM